MGFVQFMRSWPGRLLRIAVGCALFAFGATRPSLVGLVLMMVGVVPAVMGVAGICLIEEVLNCRRKEHPERATHDHRDAA